MDFTAITVAMRGHRLSVYYHEYKKKNNNNKVSGTEKKKIFFSCLYLFIIIFNLYIN